MKYLMFIKHAESVGEAQAPKPLMEAMDEHWPEFECESEVRPVEDM